MINALFKKPLSAVIDQMAGKKKYQFFFTWLYNIAIKGFNLRNFHIKENGELRNIENIASFYSVTKNSKVTVLDVGANQGDFSEEILSVFKGKIDLHAFEPLKSAFKKLSGRADSIGDSSFHIYNFGFGNQAGTLQFYADHESSELGSMYNRDMSVIDIKIKPIEEVEIQRLEDFCLSRGISHINFLKIDVEGAEIEVLKGAGSFIRESKVDFIQFEYGAGNYDSKTYLKDFFIMLSENYIVCRILKDSLFVMDKYHTDYEIPFLGNYFAISRNLYGKNKAEIIRSFNL